MPPVRSDQLRTLAKRVRHLGRVDRLDPVGSFVNEKLDIERALLRLADRAEGAR